jgi:hypothetical protein
MSPAFTEAEASIPRPTDHNINRKKFQESQIESYELDSFLHSSLKWAS